MQFLFEKRKEKKNYYILMIFLNTKQAHFYFIAHTLDKMYLIFIERKNKELFEVELMTPFCYLLLLLMVLAPSH